MAILEMGPLADWAEATAELLAVCVALFLPYYTDYQKKKHQRRNLKIVLQELVQAALEQRPDSVKTLDIFIKVSFLGNRDSANDELLMVGSHMVSLFEDTALDRQATQQEVVRLMTQLGLSVTEPAVAD